MSLFSGVNKDEQAQAGAPEPGLTLFPSAGPAEKEPIAEQPVPTSLSLPAQGPEHAKESSVLTPAPPLSPLRDETNPSATTATPIPLSSLGLSTNPQAGLPEQKEQSEKNTKGSAVVLDGSVKESASLPIDRLAAIGGKTPEHSSLVMNQEGTATEKRETLNFLSHSLVSGERQAPGVVNGAQNATLTPQTTTHQTSGQQTWRAVIDQAAGGISLSFHQGNREVQVQLEPPDLGKLNIRLLLDGDHVQARIIAESADVRALIQAHLPELRDALQTQRLDLDVVRVDVQSDTGERNNLAQGFQQDSRPSGQERGTPLPQWTKAESDEPVRGPSVTQRSGVSVWV
jgi:flagellar hook-length control protein FliK